MITWVLTKTIHGMVWYLFFTMGAIKWYQTLYANINSLTKTHLFDVIENISLHFSSKNLIDANWQPFFGILSLLRKSLTKNRSLTTTSKNVLRNVQDPWPKGNRTSFRRKWSSGGRGILRTTRNIVMEDSIHNHYIVYFVFPT